MYYEFSKGGVTAGDNVYWKHTEGFLQWCDGRNLSKVKDGKSFGYVSLQFNKIFEDENVIVFVDLDDDTLPCVMVFNKENEF